MKHVSDLQKLKEVNGLLLLRKGLTLGHQFIQILYNRTYYEDLGYCQGYMGISLSNSFFTVFSFVVSHQMK